MSEQTNGQVREDQQRTRTFNPGSHLVQLKSKEGAKDYLPVQWRLVWFREQCPHGTIDTEEIEIDLDREVEEETVVWNSEKKHAEKIIKRAKGYARFKAVVTDGQGGRATGTKSENAASFPDFIEKAETGAIGRALAGLGYGTQFAPEFDEAHRIVDAPVPPAAINGNNGHSNDTIVPERSSIAKANGARSLNNETEGSVTEPQVASIRKLCERLGKTEPENIASLSVNSAAKVIQQLSIEYRESKQNKAS